MAGSKHLLFLGSSLQVLFRNFSNINRAHINRSIFFLDYQILKEAGYLCFSYVSIIFTLTV